LIEIKELGDGKRKKKKKKCISQKNMPHPFIIIDYVTTKRSLSLNMRYFFKN
jgi:hypothetical protein